MKKEEIIEMAKKHSKNVMFHKRTTWQVFKLLAIL